LLLQVDGFHKKFSLWRIPPLKPVLGIRNPLHHQMEIFHLASSPNQYCYASSQSAWFRSYPDDIHHIDLLGIASNGQHGVARYVLKHTNRNGDLHLPPFIPLLSLQFLVEDYPPYEWIRGFSSTHLWDDSALLLWMEDQTLVANLSQIFPNSPASSSLAHSGVVDSPTLEDDNEDRPWRSGKSTSIILYDQIDEARRGHIAHCPMSGRLCVLSSNGIHVMDYLAPPA
jgi:hypothetical protein